MNLPAENTAPSAGPFVLLLGTACVKLPSVQHTAGVRAAAGPRGWVGEASVLLPPSATPVSGGRVAFSCSMNLLSVSTKIDTYMRTTSQIPTIPTFPFVLFLGKEKIELLFCLFVFYPGGQGPSHVLHSQCLAYNKCSKNVCSVNDG